MLASFPVVSSFDPRQLFRVLLVAAILTVGSLQVTRCSEDDDIDAALRDQHDRMHNMVTTWGGQF